MKIVSEVREAEKILKDILRGEYPENALWVSLYEEIMLVVLSIDLNFLTVPTLAFQTLGFKETEPVEFHFYMNDVKMINYRNEDILKLSLSELIGLGLMKFDCY